MVEKEVFREKSEIVSAGFEVHFDGDARSFVVWARNAVELEKVKGIAEAFKGCRVDGA